MVPSKVSDNVAYEQAHLVCYSREHLGGGAAICKSARLHRQDTRAKTHQVSLFAG